MNRNALFLILLLSADILLISIHLINFYNPFISNIWFSIEIDRGYPEFYQYLKWFWIIVLFIYIAVSKKTFSYLSWIAVFIYFLADDAYSIHEKTGLSLANEYGFNFSSYIRPQDIGELIITFAVGIILSILVMIAYFLGSSSFKKFSREMILLVFALAFFGVLLDFLQHTIHLGENVTFYLGSIEDGGEMIVASIILWKTFHFSSTILYNSS